MKATDYDKYRDQLRAEIDSVLYERCNLYDSICEFVNEHSTKDGKISASDADKVKQMESELDRLDALIESKEKAAARADYQSRVANPILDSYGRLAESPFTFDNLREQTMTPKLANSSEYRKNFFDAVRGHFENDAADYLRESLDAAGGYLLPTEMHDAIEQKLIDENVLRKIGRVIKTQARHQIPFLVNRPQASWIAEGASFSFGESSFEQISLGAFKLAAGIKISNELLQDSYFNLESFFADEFAKSLAIAEENAFISGSGNGEPTGILTTLAEHTDTSLVYTNDYTGVSPDDLVSFTYSLERPYRQNACWLMHDSTLAIIRAMKDGDNRFQWTVSISDGEPEKLLGYPIFTSPAFPAYDADSVICAFGDFSRFLIANRGEITFRPLRELYAANDLSAFLLIERVDARLIDTDAVKLLKIKSRD